MVTRISFVYDSVALLDAVAMHPTEEDSAGYPLRVFSSGQLHSEALIFRSRYWTNAGSKHLDAADKLDC